MSDLIERLRARKFYEPFIAALLEEAADEIERLQERFDLALRKNGEQWAEIERMDRLITLKNRQLREDADEIERLRAHIEWIGANTDSPSTALYCHAALKETDDD